MVMLTLTEVAADPLVEGRAELLREVRALLVEWEAERSELVKGRLLQALETLRLLVVIEVTA